MMMKLLACQMVCFPSSAAGKMVDSGCGQQQSTRVFVSIAAVVGPLSCDRGRQARCLLPLLLHIEDSLKISTAIANVSISPCS